MVGKQPPHVQQALNELESTSNPDQRMAALKRMAAAGVKPPEPDDEPGDDTEDEDVPAARKAAPRGRTTRQGAKGATA